MGLGVQRVILSPMTDETQANIVAASNAGARAARLPYADHYVWRGNEAAPKLKRSVSSLLAEMNAGPSGEIAQAIT